MPTSVVFSAVAVLVSTAAAAPIPDDGQYHATGDLGLYTWKPETPAATPVPTPVKAQQSVPSPVITSKPVTPTSKAAVSPTPAAKGADAPVTKQDDASPVASVSKADILAKCQVIPSDYWAMIGLNCDPNAPLPKATKTHSTKAPNATNAAASNGGGFSQLLDYCSFFTNDDIISQNLNCPLTKRDETNEEFEKRTRKLGTSVMLDTDGLVQREAKKYGTLGSVMLDVDGLVKREAKKYGTLGSVMLDVDGLVKRTAKKYGTFGSVMLDIDGLVKRAAAGLDLKNLPKMHWSKKPLMIDIEGLGL